MKNLILLSVVSLTGAALMGCAHGMKIPGSVEEAQANAQGELDAQKEDVTKQANDQVTDVQSQAQGKLDDAKSGAMNQIAGANGAMSKAIAAEVLRRMPLIGDARTLTYANTVGQYVAEELVPSLKCHADGTAASSVRVAIVKSPTPASFSLPGGMIFVTTGEMQKLSSEDEFAGVLANEMVMSICEKGVPSNLAAEAATGWSDYVTSLPTKSLNRNDLAFADKYALVTLYRRGYDVAPYPSFIAKNENAGRHLYGTERAAALQKSIAATPPVTSTSAARLARFNSAKSKSM